MSLINCPECGKEISNQANNCPNCGHPINNHRKKSWVYVVAGIFGVIALFVLISAFTDISQALGTEKINPNTADTHTTKAQDSINPTAATTPTVTPSETSSAKKEKMVIPDSDKLISLLSVKLETIGVKSMDNIVWENNKVISDTKTLQCVTLDMTCATESRNIKASCMYTKVAGSTNENFWSITSIQDADTGNFYYAYEGLESTVDIYDYKTGDLISSASKTHEEIQDEIDGQLDESDKAFQEKLDSLKEK